MTQGTTSEFVVGTVELQKLGCTLSKLLADALPIPLPDTFPLLLIAGFCVIVYRNRV
jgi:hypothetical protein